MNGCVFDETLNSLMLALAAVNMLNKNPSKHEQI